MVQIITILFIFSLFRLNFITKRKNYFETSVDRDLHFPDLFPTGYRLSPHVKDGAEQRPSVCFSMVLANPFKGYFQVSERRMMQTSKQRHC